MKKKINKPMRAAGALLVATMLTTCMTAGTFAKYTTTDSATDSARVAKFGVNVSVNGSLFGEEYKGPTTDASTNNPIAWSGIYTDGTDGKGTGTVQVYAQGENVVAPGTQNDTGLGFAVTGKPEVDCTVDITIETKNIYLKKGDYAVMQTVLFNTADDYAQAVKNDNIYKFVTNEWTKEANTNTVANYDSGATYCIKKDVVNSTDFTAEYYYPVVYTATDKRTSGAVAAITGNQDTNTLEAIANGMYAMRDTTYTNGVENTVSNSCTKTIFRTWTQQANREFNNDFPQEVLTWKWVYEDLTNMLKYDKLDTILGNLVAQEGLAENPDTVFTKTPTKPADTSPSNVKCSVVKTTNSGSTYTVPEMATASTTSTTDHIGVITTEGDFNLKTAVYFSATATQVD